MKICVDENIPLITVVELRNLGHDVPDIRGTDDQGIPDDLLWEKVQKEKRLLITTDKGFVHYRRESHCGILVVRLHQPNERKIHERVMGAVRQFADDEWNGLLVVMRDAVQSSWRETY
jgi:predicted nuclease of predicted toxin-antitoxin system